MNASSSVLPSSFSLPSSFPKSPLSFLPSSSLFSSQAGHALSWCGSAGRTRIRLKSTGEVFSLVPPNCKAHNVIVGRTWVDSAGDFTLLNATTGAKGSMVFTPCGWFGSGHHEVSCASCAPLHFPPLKPTLPPPSWASISLLPLIPGPILTKVMLT